MTKLTLSALAAVLAFVPAGAGAQNWDRNMGQQYGEEAYGYDLRGPYYAPDQERNRYGQNLNPDVGGQAGGNRQQAWNEPRFGDDSRPPWNYYGPVFEQQPRGDYYADRPAPPGVGGSQQAAASQGPGFPEPEPDVIFYNPVTDRVAAFWVEEGASQDQADRRYGEWIGRQASGMDQAYEQWRSDRIAEMDRSYEQWRRQQVAEMDRRYEEDRSAALARADQRYDDTRLDEARQARRQYMQNLDN